MDNLKWIKCLSWYNTVSKSQQMLHVFKLYKTAGSLHMKRLHQERADLAGFTNHRCNQQQYVHCCVHSELTEVIATAFLLFTLSANVVDTIYKIATLYSYKRLAKTTPTYNHEAGVHNVTTMTCRFHLAPTHLTGTHGPVWAAKPILLFWFSQQIDLHSV